MGFKMGEAPFKKDATPVYQVPFDKPGLVAKANDNGSIIVNKDLVNDKELMSEAMSHEKKHLKDMQDGILSYDSDSVTYKGKKYDRDSFDEGNDKLPWEAPAYKAGKERKDFDLTPNPNKLDGPPSFSPMSFDKMGGKSGRRDEDEVNMTESFGSFMVKKKWGGPAISGGKKADLAKADSSEGTEEDAQNEANENANKNKKKVKNDTNVTTEVVKGEDDKGKFTNTITTTVTDEAWQGDGTGKSWEQRRQDYINNGGDADISLEDYIKKAKLWMEQQKTDVSENKVYDPKDNEPKKEVKTPDTKKLATDLFNQYFSQFSRKKIYDSATEKMRPMTQEEILREAPGPLVAKYRKAIAEANMSGNEDQSIDNVEKGKKKGDENSESPVSMVVSRFKKMSHRG